MLVFSVQAQMSDNEANGIIQACMVIYGQGMNRSTVPPQEAAPSEPIALRRPQVAPYEGSQREYRDAERPQLIRIGIGRGRGAGALAAGRRDAEVGSEGTQRDVGYVT